MALQIQRSFDHEKKQWNIIPKGEVDISTASTLRAAINESYKEEPGNIILHFDQLSYMDSTGLGVIIGAFGRLKENDYRIELKNPKENILKLLRITSLDKILCPETANIKRR